MRVAIADDEIRARTYLKHLLTELSSTWDLVFVGEAGNGRQLIEIVHETEPDIVFVDIRMPECSGLDAIEACVKEFPFVLWVIVSAYSEFDYAQNALRLGVFDYVLKPINIRDLERIIEKAVQKKEQTIMQETARLENHVIHRVYNNRDLFKIDSSWNEQDGVQLVYCIFDANVIRCESSPDSEPWSQCIKVLRTLHSSCVVPNIRCTGIELQKGSYLIVCAGAPYRTHAALQPNGIAIAKMILEKKSKFCQIGYIPTVYDLGIVSFASIAESIGEMHNKSKERILKGIGVYYEMEYDQIMNQHERVRLLDCCIRIIRSYSDRDYIQFIHEIESLGQSLGQVPLDDSEGKCLQQFFTHAFDLESDTENGILSTIHTIRSIVGDRIKPDRDTHGIVRQMIDYVDSHYHEDIGIDVLASHLQKTPNYLSALFHEKTERHFVAYVSEKRIEAAKRLLVEKPQESVASIARLVGYKSSRYFAKKFLRNTGLHPSEFRERSLQKDT